jgi:hypothetical protein
MTKLKLRRHERNGICAENSYVNEVIVDTYLYKVFSAGHNWRAASGSQAAGYALL